MDFDNYQEADEDDETEAPIGVHIDVAAIVDTDNYETATDAAKGVAEYIEESFDDEDIELHASATTDTFDPDN